MSLIPPESLSFPDDFSRSISRARILEECERYARKHTRTRPSRSKRARPVPQATVPIPAPAPEPAPAPIEKPTPVVPKTPPPEQPPIARKPIAAKPISRQANTTAKARPASVKPAPRVRLTKSIRPEKVDVDLAPRRPNPPVTAQLPPKEAERVLPLPPVVRRRRKRSRRFLAVEIPAVVVLLLAAFAGLTHQFSDPIALMVLNGVTVIAAFVSAVTPIVFFAKSPILPPNER